MQSSRMRRCISIALVALVVISVASAGCLENVDFAPNEVQHRGNIIAVDSEYVDLSTIIELLLDPETYQPDLFKAIDQYLPNDKPVVEVGVGLGTAMAAISQKLNSPKQHVAVTPNPYMLSLLETTAQKNSLPIVLKNYIISYDVTDSGEVPISISKNMLTDVLLDADTPNVVMVPTATISDIIAESAFADANEITLVVESQDQIYEIFEKEPEIYDHVSTVIAVTHDLTRLEHSKLLNLALRIGYSPKMISNLDVNGYRVLVFKR